MSKILSLSAGVLLVCAVAATAFSVAGGGRYLDIGNCSSGCTQAAPASSLDCPADCPWCPDCELCPLAAAKISGEAQTAEASENATIGSTCCEKAARAAQPAGK